MAQTSWWQRVLMILLLPVIIPGAVVAGIFSKPQKRTPEEVVSYISDFIDGRGLPYDWDDFTSVDIDDVELEAIRARAAGIALPINNEGQAALQQLLNDAREIQRRRV